MECIYYNSKEDLKNKKYHEMKKIIKKDFQKLLILFENYENSSELINELEKAIANICNNKISYTGIFTEIDLLPNYLCFDYIDPYGYRTDENCDYITVIMSRNTKNFYFVYRLNPNFGTIIKEFNIKNKAVIYNEYKDSFASAIFEDKILIDPDILKLKKLEKIN